MQYSKLTTDDLVEEFIERAIDHWNAAKQLDEEGKPDVKNYNRTAKILADLRREFIARGALKSLLPLVEHEHLGVRMAAASYCVPLAPERMLALFEEWHKSSDQQTRVEAGSSLRYWREELAKAGKLPERKA